MQRFRVMAIYVVIIVVATVCAIAGAAIVGSVAAR